MQKRMKEVQKVRKRLGKSILACLIILGMLFSVMPIVDFMKPLEVEAAGINDSNVFIKQQTTVTCTLASATMMLRRTAILSGRSDWTAITENSVGNVAWTNAGLLNSFTYSGMTVSLGSFSGDKKSQLINLLSKYPQGIVAYNKGNAGQWHAVLITDYTSGVFYCADPATQVAGGRIPLSQCSISGVGQDGKIANFTSYWYVSSPTVSLPQSTGTVKGVVTDKATNIKSHTATINGHAVITGGEIAQGEMAVYFTINETQSGGKVGEYWDLSGGSNGRIDFLYNTDDKRFNFVLKEGTRYWYQVYAFSKSTQTEFAGGWQSFVTAIDFTPQNLGNSFYAYIKSKDSNMYISNPSVSSNSETSAQLKQKASAGTNNELWYFTRQNDGSYKIQSVFDSRTMVSWNGTVHAGYDNHYWYIQKDMDGYRLRQFEYAASGLGVSSKTEGSAISFCDVKPSVESQIFDIQIVAPENVNFRPAAVTYTGGHVYEMYDSCVNWTQANAIARKKGGHLVTITSSDEMDFLKSFMNNSQYSSSMYAGWWMGYTDVEKEGTWKWTIGETSSYTNWGSDQPDNAGGNEDYAMLWGGNNFTWNDATGKEGYGFIVEYDNLQTMVPVQTMTYNGHRYELYDIPVNKGTAAGWANQKGGYLVAITSSQEMEQISAMAKKSTLYKNNLYGWYTGLARTATNVFKWNTGEDFSYKNWYPGEPNNGNNNENCAIIRAEDAATWNDVSDNSYFGFVVEYEEDWNPELKINAPEEVLPGETFDVSISVSADPAVMSASVNLVYDNSLLETVPADFDGNGGVINGATRNLNYKENTIRFSAVDLHGIDWSNKVFTVTFRVKENVKRGTVLIFSTENIEQNMLALNGHIRPAGAVSAGTTVQVGPKYRLGDVDGDEEITAKDALAILKHDVGIAQDVFDEEAADCDKDGEVTSKDALMVLKHDVGLLSLDEL